MSVTREYKAPSDFNASQARSTRGVLRSATPRERRNFLWLGLTGLIRQADVPLFTGTELQAFQVRVGMSNTQIGTVGLVSSLMMAVSMFLTTGLSDRLRRPIRALTWLTALMAIFPIGMVGLCLLGPANLTPSVVFPSIISLTIVEASIIGLLGMVQATVFVRCIGPAMMPRFFTFIGFAGSAVGMGLGVAAALALRWLSFPLGFLMAFAVAMVLLFVAAFCASRAREVPELRCEPLEGSASPFSTFGRVIRMREFLLLAPPNILRGLGDGAVVLALAVGMRRLNLPVEYGGWTTAINYAAIFLGTLTMGFAVERFGSGRVLFAASLTVAAGLLGVVLAPSPILFLIAFWVMSFGAQIEGYTVPLAHYDIVPAAAIGAFTGVRLMILSGVSAIAAISVGYLLDRVSPLHVFIACATIKVFAGMLFWRAFHIARKNDNPA
jgi:MFS family permease